jgi:hypothetical protein
VIAEPAVAEKMAAQRQTPIRAALIKQSGAKVE